MKDNAIENQCAWSCSCVVGGALDREAARTDAAAVLETTARLRFAAVVCME